MELINVTLAFRDPIAFGLRDAVNEDLFEALITRSSELVRVYCQRGCPYENGMFYINNYGTD